jgi:hypothetical protein
MGLRSGVENHCVCVPLGELVYCGTALPRRQLCFDVAGQRWALQPRKMHSRYAAFYSGLIFLVLVCFLWLATSEGLPLQRLSDLWSPRASPAKLDRVLEISDAQHLLVSYRQAPGVQVKVGQPLPSGAILLKINMETKTAQTDFGLLTME